MSVRRCVPVAVLSALGLVAAACAPSGGQTASDGQGTNPAGVVIETPSNSSGYRGTVFGQDPYRMPDVTLTDTSGQPFNLRADTDAPVTLVFFGYTECPDICGPTVASVASALRQIEPPVRDKIEFVFITTDPQRDSPEVLREYLDRFNSSFVGLTGPMSKIKKAADPLNVSITGKQDGSGGDYTVGHTGQVFAFESDDKARVLWTPGTPVGDLRHDFARLVRSATPAPNG